MFGATCIAGRRDLRRAAVVVRHRHPPVLGLSNTASGVGATVSACSVIGGRPFSGPATTDRRASQQRDTPGATVAVRNIGHAQNCDTNAVWTAWPLRDLPSHLLLAAGVTSFWRGAWYVLDVGVFPDSTLLSGGATLCLGWGGFAVLHYGIIPSVMARPGADTYSRLHRTFAVYLTGLSVVCCWRGVWVLWDALFEIASGAPDGLVSGLTSHIAGAAILVAGGHFTAMLAPPARIAMLPDIKHLVRHGDIANILQRTGPAKNDPHAL